MADIDTVSSAEEIAAAKMEGWVDGDQFEGREGKAWVPAKEFLEKGKHILPIVQKKNEELSRQVAELSSRLAIAESASRAQAAALVVLEASHDEDTKVQVEAARAELKEALAAAHEAGDHAQIAELTGKMVDLKDAERDAAAKKKAEEAAAKGNGGMLELHPEVKAWFESHKEFIANPRKAALANAISAEMRQKGDKRIGKVFLDDVQAETELALAGGQKRGGDGKVESSQGGGDRGAGDEKTYSDLPADAKAICDSQSKRLVGPGRAHQTVASWRKSYVSQYFSS